MIDASKFMVCAKRCKQCLYGPEKIVDEARKAELITSIEIDDSYFVCHMGSLTDNNQLCCRGWYDANPTAKIVLLAKALGCEQFIEVPAYSDFEG